MKRFAALVLLWVGCHPRAETVAPKSTLPDLYPNDISRNQGFVPNSDFVPEKPRFGIIRSALSLEGEIVVVEGDTQTVSSMGGSFGISDANQAAIVQEVLSEYPDVFDTIQIYTSFVDEAHVGTAYYQAIKNDVRGIGVQIFDGRSGWGLPDEGRLSGFSNMNSMLMWGGGSFTGLNQIGGSYHAVIAQELSHRWLFRMVFDLGDGNGARDDLIGRQDAHWSRLAHSEGSIQDGQSWEKVGDRLYENKGTNLGFAPLDNYAMGFIGADEVPDFFYLSDATLNGDALGKTSQVPRGAQVVGMENPVTMEDVLRAMGPRNPPVATENPYYRAAFVLVTAPGESRASWGPHLNALQEVQRDFPESWRQWTKGSSAICTKVTERCPEPLIELAGHSIEDGNDDLVAPGETFQLGLSIINQGVGTAANVSVELTPVGDGSMVTGGPITVPSVGAGEVAVLPGAFTVTVSSTVACGGSIAFAARFVTEEGPVFRGRLTLGVGTKQLRLDPLDEAPNWTVDPDGEDTALRGMWDLGQPEFSSVFGVVTQPGSDHSPGESKLSFHTGSQRMGSFSANELHDGFTTLQSPPFALRGTRDPRLVFWYWRLARDFTDQEMPKLQGETVLRVLATNDGGENWVDLGELSNETKDWTRAEFHLRDVFEPTNRVMFRFVIGDESGVFVEAGIDDVEVVDVLDSCEVNKPTMDAGVSDGPPVSNDEKDGCGCAVSSRTRPSFWGLILLLIALRLRRSS